MMKMWDVLDEGPKKEYFDLLSKNEKWLNKLWGYLTESEQLEKFDEYIYPVITGKSIEAYEFWKKAKPVYDILKLTPSYN